MKSTLFLIMLWHSCVLIHAQGVPIKLANASFEDYPMAGRPPQNWYDCGFPGESPPDTQVDGTIFQVSTKAQNGKTYLGMVARDNDTWESVSQRLSAPIIKGQCYSFSLWLCRSKRYFSLSKTSHDSVEFVTPIKVRIWGGMGYCDKKELLAESSLVDHSDWKRYDFKLKPSQNLSYIQLEAFYKTPILNPYNGNLLVDNASEIIPIPCDQPASVAQVKPPVTAKPTPKPPVAKPPIASAKPPVKKPESRPEILTELDRNKLKTGQIISIRNLTFDADSASIKRESYPVLDEIYRFLANNKDVIVEIGGHTNNRPPDDFCDRLSSDRARAVTDYLVEKGISTERIKFKGYGKRNPIADNNTSDGRLKNQRVEIKILSLNG